MKKNQYIKPEIESIELDNSISLQLSSDPASGPGEENLSFTPDFFINDQTNSLNV